MTDKNCLCYIAILETIQVCANKRLILNRNTWNHFTVRKKIELNLSEKYFFLQNVFTNHINFIYNNKHVYH